MLDQVAEVCWPLRKGQQVGLSGVPAHVRGTLRKERLVRCDWWLLLEKKAYGRVDLR